MKKIVFLLLSIISLTAFAQQKKVAVYVMGDDEGINKVLGNKLVTAIARSEEYSAVERTAAFLSELGKEQKYQRTGAVDDDEISRLGKQFGVQYVCVAAVTEAFNEKYLSARLINVESAQVERTASSSGAIQSLENLVSAANSVSDNLLANLEKGTLSNSKKVAVYVVKNDAGKDIGRVLGDKLVAGFTNSGRYIAIERTNSFLSQLSKEQNYQQSGAVDDNELSRLGKQFGVEYVCVADISDVLGEKYISARLINVETAEVVNSYDVGGPMIDMNSCLKMANEIAQNLAQGTFEEQAQDARIKAEKEARLQREQAEREEQIKQQKEEELRRIEQQQQIQESAENIAESISELVNVLTTGSANPTYSITVYNHKNSTYKIHFGDNMLGYVQGGRWHTFTVSKNLYGTLKATQSNGYILYPTVYSYSIPQQTKSTNIELHIQ